MPPQDGVEHLFFPRTPPPAKLRFAGGFFGQATRNEAESKGIKYRMVGQLALEWLSVVYAAAQGFPMRKNVPLSKVGFNIEDLDHSEAMRELVEFGLVEIAKGDFVRLTQAGATFVESILR